MAEGELGACRVTPTCINCNARQKKMWLENIRIVNDEKIADTECPACNTVFIFSMTNDSLRLP